MRGQLSEYIWVNTSQLFLYAYVQWFDSVFEELKTFLFYTESSQQALVLLTEPGIQYTNDMNGLFISSFDHSLFFVLGYHTIS